MHLHGTRAFLLIWLGQLISIFATQMSQFALTIWAFEKTGSATAVGLMQVFYITPFLLISPLAGVWVDHYSRKWMMALSDLGAVTASGLVLVFAAGGRLEMEALYAAAAINGLFSAFQWPAYSASISLMVPKDQLGRANGLMSLLEAGPGVAAPLTAGALYPFLGLNGLLAIDFVTFFLALAALAIVAVPQPARSEEMSSSAAVNNGLLQQASFGFRYIFARPHLLGLQIVFFLGNLFGGVIGTLTAPMVLSRTANDELALAGVMTAGAIGGVAGGVLMTAWGGPKQRVHGVLAGHAAMGAAMLLLGFGRAQPFWMAALFLEALIIPIVNGSNQAIWQTQVAADVQGRVFTARRMIAWLTNPITPLMAGLTADRVLEPALRDGDGALATTLGPWFGIGPGAGMAVAVAACAASTMLVGLGAYAVRALRKRPMPSAV
jgi:MFS family permease